MEMDINNPWIVENIEAFHYYCCPECSEKYQKCEDFQKHAVSHHPKAKILFENSSDIKNERLEEDQIGTETELEVNVVYLIIRKYPLRGYILGVLTHTTASDHL